MVTKERQDKLEDLLDEIGSVTDLLTTLSEICYLKAVHVSDNWQDEALARTWEKAGNKVNKLAENLLWQ